MTALLQVQNLGKSFDDQAVFESVTFEVRAGQHLALLGSSGCGKSTLLRLLAGLDTPQQGRIWMNGRMVSEPDRILVPPHERKLAMLFQDLALWPNLTALENVLLGLASVCEPKSALRERATAALDACRVAQFSTRLPGTLSIGQQQRVALARAVAVRPALLLLDEPFTGLDLALKGELIAEIAGLASTLGTTLVLVTHDPFEVKRLCTDAFVIEDGRCAESGELTTLLAAPRSRTLQAFAAATRR